MPFYTPPFTINNGDIASAVYITNMLAVSGFASSALVILGNSSSSGSSAIQEIALASNLGFTAGALDIGSSLAIHHSIGAGSPPTAVGGVGAGSGATVTILSPSYDCTGVLKVVAGTGATSGTVATVTFNTAFAAIPSSVVVTAYNQQASAIVVYAQPASNSSWELQTTSALSNLSTYEWNYRVN